MPGTMLLMRNTTVATKHWNRLKYARLRNTEALYILAAMMTKGHVCTADLLKVTMLDAPELKYGHCEWLDNKKFKLK